MSYDRFKWSLLAVAGSAIAACGGENGDADSTGVASPEPAAVSSGVVQGGSDLRLRNDTYRELDGDEENAERLVATVSKGPIDLTMVRLEIRTSKDRILYRHEWPAVAYVKYDDAGAAKDSVAVLRATELQMAKIFADSAFITGASVGPRFSGKTEPDLDAIRYDIAGHDYRAAKNLKKWDPLPPRAYDEVNALARAIPLARIQAVAAETLAMPAFWYYAGGEETYVVAWSASEGRMIRIAACC